MSEVPLHTQSASPPMGEGVDDGHTHTRCRDSRCAVISHKVFTKSFGKSKIPHESVDLFLILEKTKEALTSFDEN